MTPLQLKKSMSRLGYDNNQMAEAIGVDYSSLTRYLTGKRKISKTISILVNLLLANGNKEE